MKLNKLRVVFVTTSPYSNGGISTWVRLIQSYLKKQEYIVPFLFTLHMMKKSIINLQLKGQYGKEFLSTVC